ncbi:hypothetical protein LTR01_008983, partial [Friedmanniomyces endolithicus]
KAELVPVPPMNRGLRVSRKSPYQCTFLRAPTILMTGPQARTYAGTLLQESARIGVRTLTLCGLLSN